MPSSAEIVNAAREYLGTPFHHQGRVKGVGVDCAGLLVCVGRDLGLNVFDDVTYAHEPDPALLRMMLASQLKIVNPHQQPEPGDIVLMRWGAAHSQAATHLGIVSDIGLIHAYAPAHKVVETSIDDDIRRSIVGRFRWPS